jgi:Zn-dependent alcohol dehydrogenase
MLLGHARPRVPIPQFVELWRAGRLPVESLVSSTITLDGINAGMDQLADGKAVRQLISFT